MNIIEQTDNEIRTPKSSLEVVGGLFLKDYLERFRIHYPKSLLDPDFNMLKDFRCPICYCKLHWQRDQKIARCKSKRKDKFFIRKSTFDKITKQ